MSEDQKIVFDPQPPICAECKHLLGRRTFTDQAEKWKCLAPRNVKSITVDLVTGLNQYNLNLKDCYAARRPGFVSESISCGPEGRWFEPYEPPHRDSVEAYPPRKRPAPVDADELLKGL